MHPLGRAHHLAPLQDRDKGGRVRGNNMYKTLYRRSTNNSNGGMLKIAYINKPQTGYIIIDLTHALNTYSHKQELHVDIEDTDRLTDI